jgi:hypothetical protein
LFTSFYPSRAFSWTCLVLHPVRLFSIGACAEINIP